MLGTIQDGLALTVYLFQASVQSLASGLQALLMLVDGLSLALPVALVTHNVLQVLVALDILATHYLRGVVDDLFGDACLPGYLYGKRRARLSY